MSFDLFLAAVAAGFAVKGLWDGLVRQVTHWSGLAIGYFAAWPVAAALTPSLAPRLRVAPIGVEVSLAAILYLFFYAASALAVQSVIRRAFGEHQERPWDRWGGAALGAGKGALILYMVLSAAVSYEKPLTRSLGHLPASFKSSRIVGLVRRHDYFTLSARPAAPKKERGIIVP